MTAYLDCNATTPIEPSVADTVVRFLSEEFGNAGSRTHAFGAIAKRAVNEARVSVAEVVSCEPDEVVFTSGATESNNLALLGLAPWLEESGRRHIVSTEIEHKAVLEPLQLLGERGFEVTLVGPDSDGRTAASAVLEAIRPDTGLVSVMHANNETGVIQPIVEIAAGLADHPAYLHVDAAQTFGKVLEALRCPRLDLISVSGHKIFGPKGVGALVARRRGYERVPLRPLMVGGGQERGLRPGTLPVALIAGLGEASRVAMRDASARDRVNRSIRSDALETFLGLGGAQNGAEEWCMPHVLNVSIPGIDSEAVMVALKDLIAISNGSACTSASYLPSHVLTAMRLSEDRIKGALRVSWCHLTPTVPWGAVRDALMGLAV